MRSMTLTTLVVRHIMLLAGRAGAPRFSASAAVVRPLLQTPRNAAHQKQSSASSSSSSPAVVASPDEQQPDDVLAQLLRDVKNLEKSREEGGLEMPISPAMVEKLRAVIEELEKENVEDPGRSSTTTCPSSDVVRFWEQILLIELQMFRENDSLIRAKLEQLGAPPQFDENKDHALPDAWAADSTLDQQPQQHRIGTNPPRSDDAEEDEIARQMRECISQADAIVEMSHWSTTTNTRSSDISLLSSPTAFLAAYTPTAFSSLFGHTEFPSFDGHEHDDFEGGGDEQVNTSCSRTSDSDSSCPHFFIGEEEDKRRPWEEERDRRREHFDKVAREIVPKLLCPNFPRKAGLIGADCGAAGSVVVVGRAYNQQPEAEAEPEVDAESTRFHPMDHDGVLSTTSCGWPGINPLLRPVVNAYAQVVVVDVDPPTKVDHGAGQVDEDDSSSKLSLPLLLRTTAASAGSAASSGWCSLFGASGSPKPRAAPPSTTPASQQEPQRPSSLRYLYSRRGRLTQALHEGAPTVWFVASSACLVAEVLARRSLDATHHGTHLALHGANSATEVATRILLPAEYEITRAAVDGVRHATHCAAAHAATQSANAAHFAVDAAKLLAPAALRVATEVAARVGDVLLDQAGGQGDDESELEHENRHLQNAPMQKASRN